jgi:hypothetical protein
MGSGIFPSIVTPETNMKRERISKHTLALRKLPPECLCCGEAQPWVINSVGFTSPFRGIDHTVSASVNQCRHCDAISTTPEQFEVITVKVRDAHKAWVSKRLKNVMKELSFTLDGLVHKTGLARATVARASCGDMLIEASTEKLLWHEIEILQRERIARIWTTMEVAAAVNPRSHIRIKIHTNERQSAMSFGVVMAAAAHSPLAYPCQALSQESDFELPEYAYA